MTAPTDELLERMARAIRVSRLGHAGMAGALTVGDLTQARNALSALRPDDEVAPNLSVYAGETIYSAECQASEKMRARAQEAALRWVQESYNGRDDERNKTAKAIAEAIGELELLE